jgi:hypothetical protein
MTDKYIDPPNVEEIIEKIKNLPTLGDIKPLLDEIFPNWMVGTIDEYSDDYPSLKKNWKTICKTLKVPRTQILLIDNDLNIDENHKLVCLFSEILTKSGFCVRSKNHLFPCKKCGKALAQPMLYDLLKEKGIQTPSVWSPICENC